MHPGATLGAVRITTEDAGMTVGGSRCLDGHARTTVTQCAGGRKGSQVVGRKGLQSGFRQEGCAEEGGVCNRNGGGFEFS